MSHGAISPSLMVLLIVQVPILKDTFPSEGGAAGRAVSPSHFLSHERSSGADQRMYRLAREGEMLTKQV